MLNISILIKIFLVSFYSLNMTLTNGTSIGMDHFKGKKILIVNIATNGPMVAQLSKLEQLYQQFNGKLEVIAFPSNSFGNETRNDQDINTFCLDTYHVSFSIAAKGQVHGNEIQPIYKWLTTKDENGNMGGDVTGDFQKYLVDENGILVGIFAPSVGPMSAEIQNAVSGQ